MRANALCFPAAGLAGAHGRLKSALANLLQHHTTSKQHYVANDAGRIAACTHSTDSFSCGLFGARTVCSRNVVCKLRDGSRTTRLDWMGERQLCRRTVPAAFPRAADELSAAWNSVRQTVSMRALVSSLVLAAIVLFAASLSRDGKKKIPPVSAYSSSHWSGLGFHKSWIEASFDRQ